MHTSFFQVVGSFLSQSVFRFFMFFDFYPYFGLLKNSIYMSICTWMLKLAIFIGRLTLNIAYNFVKVVCTLCRNRFFRLFIFSVISLILDFEKVSYIGVYAPKCLCGSYLVADSYQILNTSLFRLLILHAANFFYIVCGLWIHNTYRFVPT